MEVITDLGRLPALPNGSVVTIGAYDGVHRGHRAVLDEVRSRATAGGHSSVLITFDRHPATVVRPESAPRLLTDLAQKLELLDTTGDVDLAVVVPFDEERSREEPEDFVSEVLGGTLAARVVVVGEDFHFGHRRRGNVVLLAEMGQRLGYEVVGVDLMAIPGVSGPVSSTAIRGLLSTGDVAGAAELLGRPHEVRGTVMRGDRRGRELGFPTANLAVPSEIALPAEGIYAGWYVRPDGSAHLSALSLGWRPTFHPGGSPVVLEAHLLDFEGDLYGEAGRIRFSERLRDEEQFGSAEALVAQLDADVAATRTLLGG